MSWLTFLNIHFWALRNRPRVLKQLAAQKRVSANPTASLAITANRAIGLSISANICCRSPNDMHGDTTQPWGEEFKEGFSPLLLDLLVVEVRYLSFE